MNLLWMLLAFLIMSGIALLYCSLLKVNIGEGTLLSASGIVGLLFLSGALTGSFSAGMYAIPVLSLAGYFAYIFCRVKKKSSAFLFRSPYYILLLALFVFSVIIYYGDFIQHIDEFHQWAMSVKYMLESDRLPWTTELVSKSHPFGTGLFYLFFQKITGYSEANMYSSAFLLMWIGFLLPFSEHEIRDWKKPAAYAAVMYVGIYSLYVYGAKNLYVDLVTAGWAGGLAGWWRIRRKKKTDYLVAGSGLVMLCFFKLMAGPLAAFLALMFMLAHTFLVERGVLDDKKRRKQVIKIVCIMLGVSVVLTAAGAVWIYRADFWKILPEGLKSQFESMQIGNQKVLLTGSAFLTMLVGTPVSENSNLKVTFLAFMVLMGILAKISADVYKQKKEQVVYTAYMILGGLFYCLLLLAAFIFFFSYEESIAVAGGRRYMSLYMIFIFTVFLSWFLQRKKAVIPKLRGYVLLALLLVFLYGANTAFIPNMTGLVQNKISYYSDIMEIRSQADEIREILNEGDAVYYLNQEDSSNYVKADYVGSAALYELMEQVSNYHSVPWKFMKNGCRIRVADFKTLDISDFPAILAGGGYTYVWIYKSDQYLEEELPGVLDCEDDIASSCLYRVIYDGETPTGLEKAAELTEKEG